MKLSELAKRYGWDFVFYLVLFSAFGIGVHQMLFDINEDNAPAFLAGLLAGSSVLAALVTWLANLRPEKTGAMEIPPAHRAIGLVNLVAIVILLGAYFFASVYRSELAGSLLIPVGAIVLITKALDLWMGRNA